MDNIKFYEVNEKYVDFLIPYAPHLFHNSQKGQQNSRKYIGVILHVNEKDYFAPLSSFKEKHNKMQETLDFIKIKNYAVINLNNMFPVPQREYSYIDISSEKNPKYKALLQAEYRIVKVIQEKIRKNARTLYKHRIKYGDSTSLGKRCNDFNKLEIVYSEWINNNHS